MKKISSPVAFIILALVTTNLATESKQIKTDTSPDIENPPVILKRQGEAGKSSHSPQTSGFQPSVNLIKKNVKNTILRKDLPRKISGHQNLANHRASHGHPYGGYETASYSNTVPSVNTQQNYYGGAGNSNPSQNYYNAATSNANPENYYNNGAIRSSSAATSENQSENSDDTQSSTEVGSVDKQKSNGREGLLPYNGNTNTDNNNLGISPQNYPQQISIPLLMPTNAVHPDYGSFPTPYYAQDQEDYKKRPVEPESQNAPPYMGNVVAEAPQKPASSSYGIAEHAPNNLPHPQQNTLPVSSSGHYYDEHVSYNLPQGGAHGLQHYTDAHHLSHGGRHIAPYGPYGYNGIDHGYLGTKIHSVGHALKLLIPSALLYTGLSALFPQKVRVPTQEEEQQFKQKNRVKRDSPLVSTQESSQVPNYLLQREHRGVQGSTNLYDYDTLNELLHSTHKDSKLPSPPREDSIINIKNNDTEKVNKKTHKKRKTSKNRRQYVNYHSPIVYNGPSDNENEHHHNYESHLPETHDTLEYDEGNGLDEFYPSHPTSGFGPAAYPTPMLQYYQSYPLVTHTGYHIPPIPQPPVPGYPVMSTKNNNEAEHAAVLKVASRPYYNRYEENSQHGQKDVMIMMTPQKFEKLALRGLDDEQKQLLKTSEGKNTSTEKVEEIKKERIEPHRHTRVEEEAVNDVETVKQRREREEKLARQILSNDKIKALKRIRGMKRGMRNHRGQNVDLSPDGPVMGLITSFAEHDKDSPECQKMALCILALKGAEKQNATRFESFLWSLATLVPDEISQIYELDNIFQAIRTKDCRRYECSNPDLDLQKLN